MKNSSKNAVKKVLKWIEYAEDDLRTAEISFSVSSNVPYRTIAFHSQQCAEKYLKAFLVYHLIDFPYTHNISTLIELCVPIVDLNKTLRSAKELSKYAVAVRYPTEYLKISKNEAQRTIRLAAKVKKVILKFLEKEGVILEKIGEKE